MLHKNALLLVIAVPDQVPDFTATADSTSLEANTLKLTLSWGEPFNNFLPITNYTVSCLGPQCPQENFTTNDNATRSYSLTNLNPTDNYTFIVVASNSLGPGEAAVIYTMPLSGAVPYYMYTNTHTYVQYVCA